MQRNGYHRRRRRGVASAIGILLMVGILMTSVIPLFMYVNRVNNYYDRTVAEMKIADDDRGREDLEVYAYGASSTSISVWLRNKGAVPVNVSRIRVMREDLERIMIFNSTNRPDNFTLQISPSSQLFFLNFSFLQGGSYYGSPPLFSYAGCFSRVSFSVLISRNRYRNIRKGST